MAEGLRVKLSVYVFGDDHGDEILDFQGLVIDSYEPEFVDVGDAMQRMFARAMSRARVKLHKEEEDSGE